MNWLKSTLSAVAGTQEPIYGPEAIQPVTKQAETTPYTVLTRDDLRWRAYQYTNVETQTFYAMADNGTLVFVQIIYSNIVGIHTTAQFNAKIFNLKGGEHIWHSDPLHNFMFDEGMYSFGADNLSLTLNEEADAYVLKSTVSPNCLVDLTFKRTTPGFVVGKNGTSYFGTDPKNPWGSMSHAFWPRCTVEGTITTPDQAYDMAGRGVFIHALQGMKPHHAAARWNFINFQTPTYTAIMMEYTTPPSYGSTKVNVGGILKDGEIIYAGATNTVTHTASAQDSENDWPEPKSARYTWKGTTSDGKEVTAEVEGSLGPRLDRIDVMAQVPGFIKSIAGSVAGTRPYIYQYSPQEKLSLKLNVGGTEVVEEGKMFGEATFIS
ncbi:oxidative stress survival Svf1-like protein [Penicillium riverlandense]|uniref:oxidative stress survival Svf1-like protein n=1 Tax=Penicillium riverlandense TaxID=1903569 RepID=UPI0025489072|nr:oxidative stress survival Svf1-like protein [Penicillium riverlandense]KAJ5832376.1 oxidative stress survival Svf1-like protein [Penicillium riverlandense]